MPSDVDPLLESLIRGMLRFEPPDRFSVADVMAHDWYRKRHPCNAPPVTVKPRGDDHALSTTVIPYLCDLHFGDMVRNTGKAHSKEFLKTLDGHKTWSFGHSA